MRHKAKNSISRLSLEQFQTPINFQFDPRVECSTLETYNFIGSHFCILEQFLLNMLSKFTPYCVKIAKMHHTCSLAYNA